MRLNTFKKLVLIMIISAAFTSCEYDKSELQLAPDYVSFMIDVQPIFNSKCISCHSGLIEPDLRADHSYNEVKSIKYIDSETPKNSHFYQKIIGNGSMAQYANELDRAIILRWIELGAKND